MKKFIVGLICISCLSGVIARPKIGDVWVYDISFNGTWNYCCLLPTGLTTITLIDTVQTDSGMSKVFWITNSGSYSEIDTLKGTSPYFLDLLFGIIGTLRTEKTVTIEDTLRVIRSYSNFTGNYFAENVYQWFLDSTVVIKTAYGYFTMMDPTNLYATLVSYNGKNYQLFVDATSVVKNSQQFKRSIIQQGNPRSINLQGRIIQKEKMNGLIIKQLDRTRNISFARENITAIR